MPPISNHWLPSCFGVLLLSASSCGQSATSAGSDALVDASNTVDASGDAATAVCSLNHTPSLIAATTVPRRVYVVRSIDDNTPLDPVTGGVLLGLNWKDILPVIPNSDPSTWNQSTFSWTVLQAKLDAAVAANKKIQIAVSAGIAGVGTPETMCPAWATAKDWPEILQIPILPNATVAQLGAAITTIDSILVNKGFPQCKFAIDAAKNCLNGGKPLIAPVPWHPTFSNAFDATIRELGKFIDADGARGRAVRVVKITGVNFRTFETKIPTGGGTCPDPQWQTRQYSLQKVHDTIVHFREQFDAAFGCDPHAPP
jgi:hypothetical protein